ncbi:MAG: DoxX family protein [Myxococcales bacterium]|nr:DoxX family protein [Myxococcales bacterium]
MNSARADLAWAMVRVVFGFWLALFHGKSKVMGDLGPFAEGVGKLGFPMPLFFAWCAALSEFAGGLLVGVGLLTRPAAAFAAFTMLVALYNHRADGVGKMELAAFYFVVMVAAVMLGGGRFSLDAVIGGMRKKKA